MKHSKFLSVAMASVMAIGAFALTACEDPNPNPGPNPGPGGDNPVGIVSNAALEGKLIAHYAFENGGAAVNPMTGEALTGLDLTLSDTATVDGQAGKGIQAGAVAATLPQYGDNVTIDGGFTFSYAGYADSADGLDNDWGVLLGTDFMSVTYGNLSGAAKDAYPSAPGVVVGRGAYSAESYAEAKAVLSTKQLQAYNAYTGYNAGIVEGAGTDYVGQICAEQAGKWTHYTVVVDATSVSFYRDGALAYTYGPEIVGSYAEFILYDVIDLDGGVDGPVTAFLGKCGKVDNVVVGQALNAEEVLALYNDVMGATKTMDDVTVKTDLNEDDIIKAEAQTEAIAKANAARAEAVTAKRAELIETAGVATLGSKDCSTAWWSVFQPVKITDATQPMSVEFYNFTSKGGNWHVTNTIIYNDNGEECVFRADNYGWKGLNGGENWAYTSTTDINFDTWTADMDGAKFTVTVKVVDGNIVLRYDIVPMDAGATYEAEVEVELSTGKETITSTLEVPAAYYVEYTITGVTTLDGLYISFVPEAAYAIFTNVTNGVIEVA